MSDKKLAPVIGGPADGKMWLVEGSIRLHPVAEKIRIDHYLDAVPEPTLKSSITTHQYNLVRNRITGKLAWYWENEQIPT